MSTFPQLQRALAVVVRQSRRCRYWNLADLQLVSGIGKGHLSIIEQGRANPCLHTIERLAAAFDRSPAQFMRIVEWIAGYRPKHYRSRAPLPEGSPLRFSPVPGATLLPLASNTLKLRPIPGAMRLPPASNSVKIGPATRPLVLRPATVQTGRPAPGAEHGESVKATVKQGGRP
jgi:transcriptional regulator with XRE-family HTH domain